jgi:phosphotransferase system  glucose/maltose/N-acetylglucosamine-specific IIC component
MKRPDRIGDTSGLIGCLLLGMVAIQRGGETDRWWVSWIGVLFILCAGAFLYKLGLHDDNDDAGDEE